MKKIEVGILGATGAVGQKFIELLSDHPWFKITALAASERSQDKKYKDVVNWLSSKPLPDDIGNLIVQPCDASIKPHILFSALDSSVAGEIEEEFRRSGYLIISNSRNHRFDANVPLLVPEVNPEHLGLLPKTGGKIITVPNCSTVGLTLALKPLIQFNIESVHVVTMQAISGAGYPGVPSLDILDNVIPFISGEERKMETEPLKILGSLKDNAIIPADIKISAQCNRVSVSDGHTECISVKFKKIPTMDQMIKSWTDFRARPQELNLPTAPLNPTIYYSKESYPQPKVHRLLDKGMAVHIGRLSPSSLFDYKFTIVSHNTLRGAAGGGVLIAELLFKENYLDL